MSENKVALTDMSVTIVCARKPITVLERRITSHTFAENGAGIYQNEGIPQVTIIVVNELPVTPINIPLILFAGNKAKFREAVLQLLAENNVEYVSYALLIRPHETQELAEMTNRYEENMKIIARDMGADMLKYIEPEVRLEGMKTEDRLRGIDPEQMIAFLSMEQIEHLHLLTTEKTTWRDLHTLDTAQKRIQLIKELPSDNQLRILNLDKLDQLVKGLNKAERATLITWLSDRIAEEDEG